MVCFVVSTYPHFDRAYLLCYNLGFTVHKKISWYRVRFISSDKRSSFKLPCTFLVDTFQWKSKGIVLIKNKILNSDDPKGRISTMAIFSSPCLEIRITILSLEPQYCLNFKFKSWKDLKFYAISIAQNLNSQNRSKIKVHRFDIKALIFGPKCQKMAIVGSKSLTVSLGTRARWVTLLSRSPSKLAILSRSLTYPNTVSFLEKEIYCFELFKLIQ